MDLLKLNYQKENLNSNNFILNQKIHDVILNIILRTHKLNIGVDSLNPDKFPKLGYFFFLIWNLQKKILAQI